MPFIPFAATVGAWMGATGATAATVGGITIVATAATVAGVGMSISSSMAQGKAAKEQAGDQQSILAQASTAEADSAAAAQKAITDRRRSILASGGQTDITGGTGLLQPSGAKKTILGA